MNFRTLDLNLLRVFDAVMLERNVTRAASTLAMTQPAVSNALRRLRDGVGEDLFVPGPSGMTPTPHALAMWPPVRESLAGLRAVFDPQDFLPREDERAFTLLTADATASVLVPPLARHLEREAPRVELHFQPLTTRDPRPMLERGTADGAVGFFPEVARALAADGERAELVHESLYHCQYVCVMRRGHPLAAEGALTLDAYCGAQHLRVSFAGRPQGYVDEAIARVGRSRRVMLTLSHFSAAAQVLPTTDLLSVFPLSYVMASGMAPELAVRALPLDLPPIEVGLLWHRRHERDPAHRWLRGTVATVAAEEFG